jgi:taurine dioxygenase
MRIEPITATIGAELVGVSLSDAAHDAGLFDEIYAALLKHRVLFLRDQDITGQDHVAFAARIGEVEGHPALPSSDDIPGLIRIYKTPEHKGSYENAWHHDNTWRPVASKACVLRCVECPPVGGDTMWANMVLAYERLPESVKTQIEGLRASHSFIAGVGFALSPEKHAEISAKWPPVEHGVVQVHPDTGEKILVLGSWATHFTNFNHPSRMRCGQDTWQSGGDLFQYLMSQSSIPEYQVRWRWRKNSVAIWDYRATQHYAVADYGPCHRYMERVSVTGWQLS